MRSRTYAKHANLQRGRPVKQASAPPLSRLCPPDRRTQKAAEALETLAEDGDAYFLETISKHARYDAAQALGLQLRDDVIRSPSQSQGSSMSGFSSPEEASKLAATADALDQLSSLVGELRSAHENSAKVAAALAGAVKLAQDGAVDVEDIFDVAREAILQGRVKQAAVDSLFDEDPGELIGPDNGEKLASRSSAGSDPLTAALRSLRK